MKTLFAVCLLCIAAGACDDLAPVPLQRRTIKTLNVVGLAPRPSFTDGSYASGYSMSTFTTLFSSVMPFEVPAHYECPKAGYGVVWTKTDSGYSITCKKVQP